MAWPIPASIKEKIENRKPLTYTDLNALFSTGAGSLETALNNLPPEAFARNLVAPYQGGSPSGIDMRSGSWPAGTPSKLVDSGVRGLHVGVQDVSAFGAHSKAAGQDPTQVKNSIQAAIDAGTYGDYSLGSVQFQNPTEHASVIYFPVGKLEPHVAGQSGELFLYVLSDTVRIRSHQTYEGNFLSKPRFFINTTGTYTKPIFQISGASVTDGGQFAIRGLSFSGLRYAAGAGQFTGQIGCALDFSFLSDWEQNLVIIEDCNFDNFFFQNDGTKDLLAGAIQASNCTIIIRRCAFKNCAVGIKTTNANLIVEHCTFSSEVSDNGNFPAFHAGYSVWAQTTASGPHFATIRSNTFQGDRKADGSGAAVRIESPAGSSLGCLASITRNTFVNCGLGYTSEALANSCVEVVGGRRCIITKNVFSMRYPSASPSVVAIDLSSSGSNIVRGNVIAGSDGVGGRFVHGIKGVSSSAGAGGNRIAFNIIGPSVDTPMVVQPLANPANNDTLDDYQDPMMQDVYRPGTTIQNIAAARLQDVISPPADASGKKIWSGIHAGLDYRVRTVAMYRNRLCVGGLFAQAGHRTHGRWKTSAYFIGPVQRVAALFGGEFRTICDGVDGTVNALLEDGDRLWVGGAFARNAERDGTLFNRVTYTYELDGGFAEIGGPSSQEVYAILRHKDHLLAVGTLNSTLESHGSGTSFDAVGIAIYNITSGLWLDPDNSSYRVGLWLGGAPNFGWGNCIVPFESGVLIGGAFTQAGLYNSSPSSTPHYVGNLAKWLPTAGSVQGNNVLSPLESNASDGWGFDDEVTCFCEVGGVILAGGSFTKIITTNKTTGASTVKSYSYRLAVIGWADDRSGNPAAIHAVSASGLTQVPRFMRVLQQASVPGTLEGAKILIGGDNMLVVASFAGQTVVDEVRYLVTLQNVPMPSLHAIGATNVMTDPTFLDARVIGPAGKEQVVVVGSFLEGQGPEDPASYGPEQNNTRVKVSA